MKKYLVTTFLMVLCLGLLAGDPGPNPIGRWKISYKIGGTPFSDILIVQGVFPNGKIIAVNDWGEKIAGVYKNNSLFITGAPSDYYLDQYVMLLNGPGSRHIGIFRYMYDFTPSWHNASIIKLSNTPAINSTNKNQSWYKLKAEQY